MYITGGCFPLEVQVLRYVQLLLFGLFLSLPLFHSMFLFRNMNELMNAKVREAILHQEAEQNSCCEE